MTPTSALMRTWQVKRWSLRAVAGALLMLGGLLAMLVGGGALAAGQYAARSWAATDEASQATRQVAAPTPRWLDAPGTRVPTPPVPTVTLAAAIGPPTPGADGLPLTTVSASNASEIGLVPGTPAGEHTNDGRTAPVEAPAAGATASAPAAHGDDAAEAPSVEEPADEIASAAVILRAPADAVQILGSEFRFLDPPEPGAQARIVVQVGNRSELPTGPLRLTLSTRWLRGWRIVDAAPTVLADRVRDGARRAFDFPGLDGHAEGNVELHLVATDDAVDPPELHLSLAPDEVSAHRPTDLSDDGAEIGRATPETVAPRPRPGPARALAIPRLGLRAAVVPTTWEPPAFVVGQLRDTANLSEGNTVLIGHLNGLGGDVFARLGELEPGDEIVATSRGLEYRFVVSETMTLPGDDSVPIQPTDEPRLTLMTCVGEWDPVSLDYSHRLWVVAEPPELAESTLTGETPGPLTRQLGLSPPLVLLPPPDLDFAHRPVATAPPEHGDPDPPPRPAATIDRPADGALVSRQVTVHGRRVEDADPNALLWLVVRAEIDGSRWYPAGAPLVVRPDGTWAASIEIGGGPGIHHAIVVAAVDAATDAWLRRHVAESPGEPLAILPDAFESGARIVVKRR